MIDFDVTLALPKSSHRRRIVAVDDMMDGKLLISSTLSLLIPWPSRKKIWTRTTCTPELTIPFFKYSSPLGNFPEANHLASTRNALHKLAHCRKINQTIIRCVRKLNSYHSLILDFCTKIVVGYRTAFRRDSTGFHPCSL